MLSIFDRHSHLGRREFLRVGSLALGGLCWGRLQQAVAGARSDAPLLKDRSVVFLFMHGGPSQFETFDPKMDAGSEIRSTTGEIPTAIPGVTFGSTYERLARLADRLTIVRSYQPGNANHDIKPLVSPDSAKTSLGAIYARIAGATHPANGMPRHCNLYPDAVDASCRTTTQNFGRFGDTTAVGAAYAPFVPGAKGDLQENMSLHISRSRLDDRRALLAQLDALRRSLDAGGASAVDRIQQQAFETILGGVADAFDLAKEDPKMVARYDTAPLVTPSQISSKWNNYNNYVDHAKSLGKLMLLARRLCEAGAGFVTVTTNFVWDNHADVNNCGVFEGMRYCGLPFDHAVSTFLEDVEARGLSDKILLVCCGEIGRTPRINKRGGRDHWAELGPLLLAGGGMQRGHVVGQSSSDGGRPASEPVTPQNVIGTIMDKVFDVGRVRLERGLPSEVLRTVTEYSPISG